MNLKNLYFNPRVIVKGISNFDFIVPNKIICKKTCLFTETGVISIEYSLALVVIGEELKRKRELTLVNQSDNFV